MASIEGAAERVTPIPWPKISQTVEPGQRLQASRRARSLGLKRVISRRSGNAMRRPLITKTGATTSKTKVAGRGRPLRMRPLGRRRVGRLSLPAKFVPPDSYRHEDHYGWWRQEAAERR
jgi:hypothetical protein